MSFTLFKTNFTLGCFSRYEDSVTYMANLLPAPAPPKAFHEGTFLSPMGS